jgi:hypothetical protein
LFDVIEIAESGGATVVAIQCDVYAKRGVVLTAPIPCHPASLSVDEVPAAMRTLFLSFPKDG